MMTQDRTHGLATSTAPRNLNPSAPAFCQSPATPASPQNLNPTATPFQHSPSGDKPTSDPSTYLGPELGLQALISNGDISVTGTNFLVASASGILREAGSQSHRMQQMQAAQGLSKGFALALNPQLAASAQSNHQPGVVAAAASAGQQQAVVTAHQQQQQQIAYAMSVPDNMGGPQLQVNASNPSTASLGGGEFYENPPNGSLGGEEDSTEQTEDVSSTIGGQEFKYPDEILAPIRKQMQFYFSSENLPSDKFLNQHMDSDKYIPLELFLDFGRIKPICSSIDLLTKAVESSSVLELSDDRKRVRVSQCRKTLTLRGFPQSATEEDVRQFILEMGAYTPTHIEFVMFKEKYSVWYVSFKDEAAALNSFFQFHNQKAVYKDHTIGCCIKSSGTLAAAGYFPSMEESNQRRLAYQNQAAVAAAAAAASIPAPVHSVQNSIPQPQPQQPPQALMQSFSTMQLHSYVPSSPANIYYQQTPQGAYMPYMTSMIQGWPGPATAMEPGLIMQNNGLQPQHIRTSMPRTHIMPTGTATQHRFNRPQRGRQGNLDRGSSERPNDRPSIVAISGISRSSPHSAESGVSALVVPQGAYVSRQTSLQEDITPPVIAAQPHVVSHQFVTPLVAQQSQPHAISPAGAQIVSPSSLDHVAVRHYQPAVHHQHQHPVVVQAAATAAMLPPTTSQLSNALPVTQQMPTHHIQPPPKIPQQQQQNNHQHQQPPMQQAHYQHQQQHFQQQQAGHLLPHHTGHHHNSQQQHHSTQQHHHSGGGGPHHHHQQQQQPPHHHNQPPPPQTSHHPYQPHNPHHHQQQQQQPHSMSPHHHQHPHHPQPQQHQFIPPPQVQHYHHQHHQQSPPNGRSEKRNRRKRDDDGRNQRPDRGQSSRASYGSQVSVDNFTMEANSFPPLTGAQQNILTSSEVSQESRVSDLVWGMSRNSTTSSSTTQHSASPVHAHLPISGATAAQHHGLSSSAIVDPYTGDDRDSLLDDDDDSASSSQGDADVDVDSLETRSVRSEPQPMASAVEPLVFPLQSSRSQKASTPVASPVTVSAPRQMDGRHGLSYQQQQQPPAAHLGHHQQQPHQHASAVTVSAAFLASDAPRPSYAQILAQKNRESTSNVSGDSIQPGGLPQNSSPGTLNGPNLVQNDSGSAVNYGGGRSFTQSANAFREHGNYHGGQQHGQRSLSQRGPPKDGLRYEGTQQFSQQLSSGRRNSKENRISSKFDRRKHDTHLK